MLNPEQKTAATNLLNHVRNVLLESPAAQRGTQALLGAGAGYLGANIANTIIPDQYDINPLLAAGMGAVGGGILRPRSGNRNLDPWQSPASPESMANAQASAANRAAYEQRYGSASNAVQQLPGQRYQSTADALDAAMASTDPRSLQHFAQSAQSSNGNPWGDIEVY